MGRTKRAVALFLISLSAARAHAQTHAAPPALSLADAIGEALVNNERVVNQADAIAQADLGLRLARNAFRPKTVFELRPLDAVTACASSCRARAMSDVFCMLVLRRECAESVRQPGPCG